MDKLYIKLDKKLILKAKNISILENLNQENEQEKINAKKILNITKQIKYLHNFIKEIDIENLTIKNKDVKILFKDGEFFIDSNNIFLKLNFYPQDNNLIGNINTLVLKDYDINLNGTFKISTKSDFYNLNLNTSNEDISFKAIFSYKDGKMLYKFNDINVNSIKNIAKKIKANHKLNECIDNWVFKRAIGEFYHLDYLQGFIDFKQDNYYLDDIKAFGYVKNVKVVLDDGIEAIKIPMLDVNFTKQKLDFSFNKASYLNYKLDKSKVYLFDLLDPLKAGISINIVSDFVRLDNNVQKILKLYNINIPFNQKSGFLKADLLVKFVFDQIDKNIFYEGDFYINDAVLDIAEFNVQKAYLKLKDNKAIIKDGISDNNFLKAKFDANINLKEKNGIFDVNISKFYLSAGLLDIKNDEVKIEFDYKNKVNAYLKDYGVKFNFDEGLRIDFLDFSLLKPYSIVLKKINFKKADGIYIFTKNFIDFEMAFKNIEFDANLYKINSGPYNKDSFFVIKNKDDIRVTSSSDLINIISKGNQINASLNGLTYIYKDDGEKIDFSNIENENIILNAKDFSIIFQDFNKTLSFDDLQAFINKDTISAKANSNYAEFEILNTLNNFSLKINNAKEQNINTFFQKDVVNNGDFSMSIIGENVKNFKGRIEFKNTFIKDLKSYNQLISFLDTIPSLLIFKSPTFNESGLNVKNGVVIFSRENDDLQIKALKINGDSVDIYGLGSVNLKNSKLDIDIELRTLKSASKVIANIPIINYIFLGDKKQFSTSLKIYGNLSDPKFKTQVLEDTIKTPFNLIKNVFTLPLNLVK